MDESVKDNNQKDNYVMPLPEEEKNKGNVRMLEPNSKPNWMMRIAGVDKFESIEGFDCEIARDRFPELIKKTGMVISGQTPDLAPADKILYSLRDVTGTVDSIPLIASSIMSKKIAGGAKALVLDVTCGFGAFMKEESRARELAAAMIRIGEGAGIKTRAVITDMDQPVGNRIGNTLEMQEVYDTLCGKGQKDVEAVVTALAFLMPLGGRSGRCGFLSLLSLMSVLLSSSSRRSRLRCESALRRSHGISRCS